ncbi:MAG TPA: polysaccharide biosynthesis/export family protein [Patescibacteria group bacterium]|nr:polysaccharide biosynthesis/export family protein [Patescibacteria group bacterium]
MHERSEASRGFVFAVVIATLVSGCAASSGTAKTEALIANLTRDDSRDNLALNSRILAMANPDSLSGDYRLGTGDLLEISVFGIEELSKIKARVGAEGLMTLPLAGTVAAGGKTAIELETIIKTALASKYIRDPQISVFVLEHHSHRISVLGAVKKPGVFEVSGPRSVVDMLAMAEGLTEESDKNVYLIRKVAKSSAVPGPPGSQSQTAPDGKPAQEVVLEINLEEMLISGKEELSAPLQAGDVVHIPRAGSFFVGGAVQRPGAYLLKGRDVTVDQAIIEAGGVTRIADFEGVKIFRENKGQKKQIIEVSLNEIEEGKKGPLVMKNDVVLVSSNGLKSAWFGFLEFIRFGVGASVPM